MVFSRTNGFILSIITVIAFLVVSCKKDNPSIDFHHDFFPLEQGRFITYSVQEVVIDDDLGLNDTLRYYLKTVMGDVITDNEGRTVHRYERYVCDSLNHPWILQDIWTAVIENGRAELVEENQRTIKLVFAPSKHKTWNCNAFNNEEAIECYYTGLYKSETVSGFLMDSTVTVQIGEPDINKVLFIRKEERYAKGIGMYYKHFKDFQLEDTGSSLIDTTQIFKGKELLLYLVDYGIQ